MAFFFCKFLSKDFSSRDEFNFDNSKLFKEHLLKPSNILLVGFLLEKSLLVDTILILSNSFESFISVVFVIKLLDIYFIYLPLIHIN